MAWDMQGNRVEDWLPESFAETQKLNRFVDQFGSSELLMVSWDGCTLEDTRLEQYSTQLQTRAMHRGQSVVWFDRVWTGQSVLETLTDEPINITRQAAITRMQGWLVGPDRATTCAIAMVSAAGKDSIEGLSRRDIHIAGPTVDGVAINHASKSSLLQFNLWSFSICLILLFACVKSIKLAVSIFATALYSVQISMAMMYFSSVQMDSVLLVVSNLTLVLTIAGGVHLVNYYLEARRSQREDPVTVAVAAARRPTVLAATTTALGMVSLCVSQITPIWNFGVFAALSVLAGTAMLLTLLPAMLVCFPPRLQDSGPPSVDDVPSTRWMMLTRLVVHLRWAILALAVTMLVFGFLGLTRLTTTTRLQDFFTPDARLMQDYRWLEQHVADLVPVEVVIEFPPDEANEKKERAANFIERMKAVEAVGDALATIPSIGGAVTARDFSPPLPTGRTIRQFAARMVRTQMLYSRRSEIQSLGFWRQLEDRELWRISLRVSSGRQVDYGQLLDTLDERVKATIGASEHELHPRFYVSGGVPLFHKTQTQLLDDLIASFGLAVLMIATVMACVLKRPFIGLAAMLPNLLPSVVVFGVMGWLGMPIEIGSMLTATVAMGIAVDDTLHYVTWFRRDPVGDVGMDHVLTYAYSRCGAAMFQTSLICSFGLVVFALSPFMPIARFAWLMFVLLLLAVLCDLVLLPAVLLITSGKRKLWSTNEAGEGA